MRLLQEGLDARLRTRIFDGSIAAAVVVLLTGALVVGNARPATAQPPEQPLPDQPRDGVVELDPTIVEAPAVPTSPAEAVFGAADIAGVLPGSGNFLDRESITYQQYDDINRVLRRAPGVYLREEDGYGNFPNISLRGVDPARSAKVTIMEDGVLTSPAPYTDPAAYYFPTVGRMAAVEVLKGHSQIRFGPHTTGGVINFLSTRIPDEPTIYLNSLYGRFNEFRLHTWVGGTSCGDNGNFGFLVEGYLRQTDGFKQIDEAPDLRGRLTEQTGFEDREPMLKLFWEPIGHTYQRWEAKVGYTDFAADETYLGLTEDDIRMTPDRRYSTTRFDNFQSYHTRSYLRYTWGDPEDWFSVTSTLYYNQFRRNWFKINDVNAGAGNVPLSRALADTGSAENLLVRGQGAGTLRYRNNNRSYYLYGYDAVATTRFDTERANHTLLSGFRYHWDRAGRFQNDERFTQAANGAIVSRTADPPGSQDTRFAETDAIAWFVQDSIEIGRLTITPGIRHEHLNQRYVDIAPAAGSGSGRMDMVGGGVGLEYDFTDQLSALAGFHRGFSPPNPRSRVRQNFREEEVLAQEYGFRYLNAERAMQGQVVYFYSHFNDLIVLDNIGGTGLGVSEQVGEVFSSGVEFLAEYDPGIDRGWAFKNPWFVVLTYTNARQLSADQSTNAESIFAGGFPGARIPYIPEWVVTLGTGVHYGLVGFNLTGVYQSRMFTTASNTTDQEDPQGRPDARFGTTDSFFIWDWSGYARLTPCWTIRGGMQNMFDSRYIVSRHPHGPRPGMPMFAYMSVEANW